MKFVIRVIKLEPRTEEEKREIQKDNYPRNITNYPDKYPNYDDRDTMKSSRVLEVELTEEEFKEVKLQVLKVFE